MKEGLYVGYKETMTFTVTEEMFAQFGGEVVHPTYSTATMVYHMEWVSRKIILPFLEEGEEGMGASVNVKHLAPSPLGTTVRAEAVVTKIKTRSITTSVVLTNEKGKIGEGEVKQALMPKSYIEEQIRNRDVQKKE